MKAKIKISQFTFAKLQKLILLYLWALIDSL